MHNHTHTHAKKSTKESNKEAGTWETVKRTSHKSISRKEGVGQELEVKLMEEGKECHQHCQTESTGSRLYCTKDTSVHVHAATANSEPCPSR